MNKTQLFKQTVYLIKGIQILYLQYLPQSFDGAGINGSQKIIDTQEFVEQLKRNSLYTKKKSLASIVPLLSFCR